MMSPVDTVNLMKKKRKINDYYIFNLTKITNLTVRENDNVSFKTNYFKTMSNNYSTVY